MSSFESRKIGVQRHPCCVPPNFSSSPCLNAIENILNIVRKMLEHETIRLQIEHEFLMISKAE